MGLGGLGGLGAGWAWGGVGAWGWVGLGRVSVGASEASAETVASTPLFYVFWPAAGADFFLLDKIIKLRTVNCPFQATFHFPPRSNT